MQDTFLFYDDLNLPPPDSSEFSLATEPVARLDAQQTLVRQGDVSNSIYWLDKGLIRAVFMNDNGKEFTKEFFWEGDIILQPRSLLTGEPLPYSMISLEACQYRQISTQRYSELIRTSPEWLHYHQTLLAIHLINKEKKEEFLLLNSPEQRVIRFGQSFPWLIQRVPDYIVASYLGMTAISYSRIKKRLLTERNQTES